MKIHLLALCAAVIVSACWTAQEAEAKKRQPERSSEKRPTTPVVSISSAGFSPDASLAITGYDSQERGPSVPEAAQVIKIWDVATGERLHTLPADHQGIRLVAFMPDGRRAISVGRSHIRMWDARKGKELWLMEARSRWLRVAVLSPDGRRLLTYGENLQETDTADHLHLWDTADGTLLKTIDNFSFGHLRFLPDSKRILLSTASKNGGELCILDVDTWKVLSSIPISGDARWFPFAFTLDAKRAVSDLWDSDPLQKTAIVLWDLASGKEVKRFEKRRDELEGKKRHGRAEIGVFTRDGKELLTWDDDLLMRVWDISQGKLVRTISPGGEIIAFSRDTKLALVAFSPSDLTNKIGLTLSLWDTIRGTQVRLFKTKSGDE